jgi:hypothetical protein
MGTSFVECSVRFPAEIPTDFKIVGPDSALPLPRVRVVVRIARSRDDWAFDTLIGPGRPWEKDETTERYQLEALDE